jgi:hypothetical protein
MSDAISKAIEAMDMARSAVGPFSLVVTKKLTESIEALQALQHSGEPVAWMSPNKQSLEFSRPDTVYGSHTIPLYASPQPVVPEGYVSMSDYKQLSALCSRQGMRLMDYETITGRMECKWTQDDDGIWHTACGNAHEFMNEGPSENEHHFCPYCGGLLSAGKGGE